MSASTLLSDALEAERLLGGVFVRKALRVVLGAARLASRLVVTRAFLRVCWSVGYKRVEVYRNIREERGEPIVRVDAVSVYTGGMGAPHVWLLAERFGWRGWSPTERAGYSYRERGLPLEHGAYYDKRGLMHTPWTSCDEMKQRALRLDP